MFMIARQREDLPLAREGFRMMGAKTAPARYAEDLEKELAGRRKYSRVGFIDYALIRTTAISHKYYPKHYLKRNLNGLPYFLEAMTAHHLSSIGFQRMRTTPMPRGDRTDQLWRVALHVNESSPIRKWLIGMGRGIRGDIRKRSKIRQWLARRGRGIKGKPGSQSK
ncbi:MAG: hypothetical protein ABH863_04965 [Candidatus Micrarchaeota archaeon]